MDYKEEQNGEIEALLSIYEGELDGNLEKITYVIYYIENIIIQLFHLNYIIYFP